MTKTLPVLSFAKLDEGMPMPHLLDIQTRAFQSLLQPDGKGAGEKKIQVIKEIRAITNLGLKEAKDMVEGAPGTVKEDVSKQEAEDIKKKLEAQGATVELK